MGQTLQRDTSAVAHRPRRWLRNLAIASALLATAGGIAILAVPRLRTRDCAATSRVDTDSMAVVVCQREYERTRLPQTGAYLADAYRRSGNVEAATAVANDLLGTDARGNALQILGKIAYAQRRADEGVRLLQEARQLHRQQSNHLGLARDDQYLAMIQSGLSHYSDALLTLEEGIVEAGVAHDSMVEAYCHLTAASVLINIGYFEAAHHEIDHASRQLVIERDLAQLWFVQGNLEQEFDRGSLRTSHQHIAVAAFERSLDLAQRARFTSRSINIHLNLAYSLAEVGRTDDAERHLAEAALLDRDRAFEGKRAQLAARIAYHQGNAALAYSLNERLYAAITDDDEQIDVCVMQARIALAKGDLTDAATWAARGVERAEQIRASQPVAELRPWVLASRREPYELLFTSYARSGDYGKAVEVFDRWQSRTLLDDMARPSPDPAPRLSGAATRIQSLGRWLPVVSKAPLMTIDERVVTQALAQIDLVAFVVAEGEIWRAVSNHGKLRLDDLGPLDAQRERIATFTSEPTDPVRANALGALLVPDDIVRKTYDPLYVVLDAQFAGLPFVALRRNGQPMIAIRPVIRAPRIPSLSRCERRPGITSATVIADAAGDLPDAQRESGKVASMFRTTPHVGEAATGAALFASRPEQLLHVAVHADVDTVGGVLRMYDRAVSAPEISAAKLRPALVVLSGCSTADAWDPELAGSLSTAFLASGSRFVVATLRAVSDSGALDLTSRFYDARGADDPVRVLAAIQAELSRTDNQDWPNFAVFGNEVCAPAR